MARFHGSKGSVEMEPSGSPGGSPLAEIASLNAWTLSMARDRVDVTAFGDTNKQYVQGLADIKGTFGGFWDTGAGSPDEGNGTLFDAAEGSTPVTLKLTPSSLDPTHYWTGLAYLDAAIDVSATGAVTISGSFVAAGDWTRY